MVQRTFGSGGGRRSARARVQAACVSTSLTGEHEPRNRAARSLLLDRNHAIALGDGSKFVTAKRIRHTGFQSTGNYIRRRDADVVSSLGVGGPPAHECSFIVRDFGVLRDPTAQIRLAKPP